MADPKPYVVARWIADEIQETNFVALRVTIEQSLRLHIHGKSEEQIAELAEGLEQSVFNEMGIVADQLLRTGIEPSFGLEGEPGTCYIRAQNIEAVRVLAHLRALTPDRFETFCANVLIALGATAQRTGGTGDGGVDFVATDLPLSAHPGVAVSACYPLVIGQAKRYKDDNLTSVTDLRCFLGGAVLKAEQMKRQDERLGLFSPVVFAFWTTSDFNVPAREFAKNTGLWCLGGLALAQLAHRIGLPITG
jgi:hypothetical protein